MYNTEAEKQRREEKTRLKEQRKQQAEEEERKQVEDVRNMRVEIAHLGGIQQSNSIFCL